VSDSKVTLFLYAESSSRKGGLLSGGFMKSVETFKPDFKKEEVFEAKVVDWLGTTAFEGMRSPFSIRRFGKS
jgi:hypothetical protein